MRSPIASRGPLPGKASCINFRPSSALPRKGVKGHTASQSPSCGEEHSQQPRKRKHKAAANLACVQELSGGRLLFQFDAEAAGGGPCGWLSVGTAVGCVSTGQYHIALRKSSLNSVYRNKKLTDTASKSFSLWAEGTHTHTPWVSSVVACTAVAQAQAQTLTTYHPRTAAPKAEVQAAAAAARAIGEAQPFNRLLESEPPRAATHRESKLPKAATKARRKVVARAATAAVAAAKAAAADTDITVISQQTAYKRPDVKVLKDAIKARRKIAAAAAAAARASATAMAADRASVAVRNGTRSDDEDLVESKKERRGLRQRERRAKAREEKKLVSEGLDSVGSGLPGDRSAGPSAEDEDAGLGVDDGSDSDEHLCEVEEDSAWPNVTSAARDEGPLLDAMTQRVGNVSAAANGEGINSRQTARRAATKLHIGAWIRLLALLRRIQWLPAVLARLLAAAALRVWRWLPYSLRMRAALVPPQLPPLHASPTLAALLSTSPGLTLQERLLSCGFDERGRTVKPLIDVPRWRLEALLRMPIRRPAIYRIALCCSAALHSEQRVSHSYERLEFLGDAVLAVVTRHKLMRAFPGEAEGFLSRVQDALVSGRALASYGRHLRLERYMLANGVTLLNNAASLRGSLSADVVEALIGAIYIDKGYAAAREFTEWLMDDAAKMRAAVLDLNFKSQLLEFCNVQQLCQPIFQTERASSPFSNKVVWQAIVLVSGEIWGRSQDNSKIRAEQSASGQALQALQKALIIAEDRQSVFCKQESTDAWPLAVSWKQAAVPVLASEEQGATTRMIMQFVADIKGTLLP